MKEILFLYILIFIFINFFYVNSSDNDIGNLKLVIVYNRHGARSPIKLYKKGYFSVGKGELTLTGQEMMYELGKKLKRDYIKKESYLPKVMNEKETESIYLISSEKSRTWRSLLYLMDGLYPSIGQFYLSQKIILNNEILKIYNNSNEIYVVTPNIKNDLIFHSQKVENCPVLENGYNRIKKLKIYEDKLNELRNGLFIKLANEINQKWGTKFLAKKMSFKDFSHINDVIYSLKNNNVMNAPDFDENIYTEIKYEKAFYIYNLKYSDKEIEKASTSKIFESFKYFIEEKKKGNGKIKIVIFSGHDSHMVNIMKAILNKEDIDLNDENIRLPYGSSLIFELREKNGKFFIITKLNDKPLKIKCKIQEKCDLEDFEKILNDNIYMNLDEFCKGEKI